MLQQPSERHDDSEAEWGCQLVYHVVAFERKPYLTYTDNDAGIKNAAAPLWCCASLVHFFFFLCRAVLLEL